MSRGVAIIANAEDVADDWRGGRLMNLKPRTRRVLLIALLTAPIVAHGCHREDIDDEPGFVLPQREPQVEDR